MYSFVHKKKCDGCGNEFEYCTYAIDALNIPTHCADCRFRASGKQRQVKVQYLPEEVVVEPPVVEIKVDIEAIKRSVPIRGVSDRLTEKYGNIKKLTEKLNKKG